MTFADGVGPEKFNQIVTDFFEHHYTDRGMVKWQGFFLSDHTSALKKQSQDLEKVNEALVLMDEKSIMELLMIAYVKGNTVEIQLAQLDTDLRFAQTVSGKLTGYNDNDLVGIDDGTFPISMIHHIEVLPLPGQ